MAGASHTPRPTLGLVRGARVVLQHLIHILTQAQININATIKNITRARNRAPATDPPMITGSSDEGGQASTAEQRGGGCVGVSKAGRVVNS